MKYYFINTQCKIGRASGRGNRKLTLSGLNKKNNSTVGKLPPHAKKVKILPHFAWNPFIILRQGIQSLLRCTKKCGSHYSITSPVCKEPKYVQVGLAGVRRNRHLCIKNKKKKFSPG